MQNGYEQRHADARSGAGAHAGGPSARPLAELAGRLGGFVAEFGEDVAAISGNAGLSSAATQKAEAARLPGMAPQPQEAAGAATAAAGAGPSSDPDRVRRSAVAVAACLACDICGGMLCDPVTAPECMHRCALLSACSFLCKACRAVHLSDPWQLWRAASVGPALTRRCRRPGAARVPRAQCVRRRARRRCWAHAHMRTGGCSRMSCWPSWRASSFPSRTQTVKPHSASHGRATAKLAIYET